MENALPDTHGTTTEDAEYEEPTKDHAAVFLSYFFPLIVFFLFIGFILMITLVAGAK